MRETFSIAYLYSLFIVQFRWWTVLVIMSLDEEAKVKHKICSYTIGSMCHHFSIFRMQCLQFVIMIFFLCIIQPERVVVPVTASNPYNMDVKVQQRRSQRDCHSTSNGDSAWLKVVLQTWITYHCIPVAVLCIRKMFKPMNLITRLDTCRFIVPENEDNPTFFLLQCMCFYVKHSFIQCK
jgi:hypothetical protein